MIRPVLSIILVGVGFHLHARNERRVSRNAKRVFLVRSISKVMCGINDRGWSMVMWMSPVHC